MKVARLTFCFVLSLLFGTGLHAQVFTNRAVGKKNDELVDSIKKSAYPYVLPIRGAKATKMGSSLPYSAGVSLNYFWQRSDLIIDNLNVGFNNGPTYNLDGIVRFDKAQATASSLSVRPDIWVFPFLTVYAIMGQASASTDVGVGVWLPDSNNHETKIASFNSKVNFKATTFGFGLTPTLGVAGGFIALDMNFAWSDAPQLDQPTFTFYLDRGSERISNLKKQTSPLLSGRAAFA